LLLAALLPNAIEGYNRFFGLLDRPPIAWQEYLFFAIHAPWTDGLFVWLMLLTTLAPTAVHLVLGTTAILQACRPTRDARLLELFPVDDTAKWESSIAHQKVARALFYRELMGFLPAPFATAIVVGGAAWGLFHLADDLGYGLGTVALCMTEWSHGYCPTGL
jgi:hypothetical protein